LGSNNNKKEQEKARQYNYKKYGHPSQPNVVKGDCSLERIAAELRAIRVVLIPVHARRVRRKVVAVAGSVA